MTTNPRIRRLPRLGPWPHGLAWAGVAAVAWLVLAVLLISLVGG